MANDRNKGAAVPLSDDIFATSTPDVDRATTVGNMQQTFGKDRTCSSGDILAERQTEKHTDNTNHTTCEVNPLRGFARR